MKQFVPLIIEAVVKITSIVFNYFKAKKQALWPKDVAEPNESNT